MHRSTAAALRSSALLRHLDSTELRFLGRVAEVNRYPAGAYVFTRIRDRPQDGAHAASERRADDAGAGVHRLRHHPRRGHPAPHRGGGAHPRDQHGSDRDRYQPALRRAGAREAGGGITANCERLRWMVENSICLVTALVPYVGYEHSTRVAREALESGRGVYELVQEKGWLSRERLDEILTPEAMMRPRAMPVKAG